MKASDYIVITFITAFVVIMDTIKTKPGFLNAVAYFILTWIMCWATVGMLNKIAYKPPEQQTTYYSYSSYKEYLKNEANK